MIISRVQGKTFESEVNDIDRPIDAQAPIARCPLAGPTHAMNEYRYNNAQIDGKPLQKS
jgi:hypothetical protein